MGKDCEVSVLNIVRQTQPASHALVYIIEISCTIANYYGRSGSHIRNAWKSNYRGLRSERCTSSCFSDASARTTMLNVDENVRTRKTIVHFCYKSIFFCCMSRMLLGWHLYTLNSKVLNIRMFAHMEKTHKHTGSTKMPITLTRTTFK